MRKNSVAQCGNRHVGHKQSICGWNGGESTWSQRKMEGHGATAAQAFAGGVPSVQSVEQALEFVKE